jgi:hypothetical protein
MCHFAYTCLSHPGDFSNTTIKLIVNGHICLHIVSGDCGKIERKRAVLPFIMHIVSVWMCRFKVGIDMKYGIIMLFVGVC